MPFGFSQQNGSNGAPGSPGIGSGGGGGTTEGLSKPSSAHGTNFTWRGSVFSSSIASSRERSSMGLSTATSTHTAYTSGPSTDAVCGSSDGMIVVGDTGASGWCTVEDVEPAFVAAVEDASTAEVVSSEAHLSKLRISCLSRRLTSTLSREGARSGLNVLEVGCVHMNVLHTSLHRDLSEFELNRVGFHRDPSPPEGHELVLGELSNLRYRLVELIEGLGEPLDLFRDILILVRLKLDSRVLCLTSI